MTTTTAADLAAALSKLPPGTPIYAHAYNGTSGPAQLFRDDTSWLEDDSPDGGSEETRHFVTFDQPWGEAL